MRPDIRFIQFYDHWFRYRVGDLFLLKRGKVLAGDEISPVKTSIMKYPVYSSQTKKHGLMGYYKEYLFSNAITWTTDGVNAGTVHYREGKFYSTNVNGVLLSDKGYANKAIAEILNKEAWKHVLRVGNPKLMNNIMKDIYINIPTLNEQIKISDFLDNLENIIFYYKSKVYLLSMVKKGFLRKLFINNDSKYPEIRFKEFNDAWERRELSTLGKFSKGKGYSKKDLISSGIPIILYGELYTNYKLIIEEAEHYVSFTKGSVCSQGGEVIIPASGETEEDLCRASVIKNPNIIIGGDLNIIQVNKFELNSLFLATLFLTSELKKQVIQKSQGKSVVHIRNKDLKKLTVTIPKIEEQSKISTHLLSVEKLIDLYERKLELLELMKKGFLQKMFV